MISAVGIVGNVENIGLEGTKVKVEQTHIVIDQWGFTGEPNVYAIGDVAGPPWLAHKAMHEGVICVEKIAGVKGVHPMKTTNIPGCTYCQPQVASVGLTEAAAKAKGLQVKVGKFPFIGNGKAIALGEPEGFVKTVFDAKTGELLGAHMIGAEVTEMIQGYTIAKTLETTEAELIATVFPHPDPVGDDARVGAGGVRPDAPYLGGLSVPKWTARSTKPHSAAPNAIPRRRIGRTIRFRASRTGSGYARPIRRSTPRPSALMRQYGLATVCEEAACPNIGECWKQKHATFMIMGETCTRACAFCNVATGKPGALNPHEPANIAEAVGKLGLGHVVVTSVDRDDLDDGGAGHFAAGDRGARTSRRRRPRSRC